VHNEKEILAQIKKAILAIVPDAQVYLFGSRARGDWHDESDWDILVLTQETVNRSLKHRIYEKVFPISLQIGDFMFLQPLSIVFIIVAFMLHRHCC
jgi:predicted nucleotidyltransferase